MEGQCASLDTKSAGLQGTRFQLVRAAVWASMTTIGTRLSRSPKSCCQLQVMKIATIVRLGVAALVMGALFGVGLPAKADQLVWVRAQQLDFFRARGLMPPGSYFHNENQKPATIAVSWTARQSR
jgi:hypothetical protein